MFNGKLEVGKEYELNNGEVGECGADDGISFFIVIDGARLYFQRNGSFNSGSEYHPLSVRGPAVGTLEELDVKPGDVVGMVSVTWLKGHTYTIQDDGKVLDNDGSSGYYGYAFDTYNPHRTLFRIISRAEHAVPDDIRQFKQWERVDGEGSGLYAFGEYRISRKTAGRYSAYVVTPLGRENTILAENANKSDAHRLCVRHSLGVDESPTLFRDMTDAEKGVFLLDVHNGVAVQEFYDGKWTDVDGVNSNDRAYRRKPKPTTEARTLYMGADLKSALKYGSEDDAYKLHFDVIDGRPCNPRFEAANEA